MTSGGHGRSGPPPDPNALRRERDSSTWTTLPPHRDGPTPLWPLSRPTKRERDLWDSLWSLPQAVMWERSSQEREVAIYVYHLCRGVAAAAWAYSILHIAYLGKRLATKPAQERRDYHLKRGLVQYVSGAFEGAKAEFLTVLRLDPMDIDARFHLAMTHQALGQHRRALKTFKRCLADDVDAKWAWEIQTQIDKVRQGK